MSFISIVLIILAIFLVAAIGFIFVTKRCKLSDARVISLLVVLIMLLFCTTILAVVSIKVASDNFDDVSDKEIKESKEEQVVDDELVKEESLLTGDDNEVDPEFSVDPPSVSESNDTDGGYEVFYADDLEDEDLNNYFYGVAQENYWEYEEIEGSRPENLKAWNPTDCPEYFDYVADVPEAEESLADQDIFSDISFGPYDYNKQQAAQALVALCDFKEWNYTGEEINSLRMKTCLASERIFDTTSESYHLCTPDKGFYHIYFEDGKVYIEDATEKLFKRQYSDVKKEGY